MGNNDKLKNEMNESLKTMRSASFELMEYMQHVAMMEWNKYRALVDNGFTEQQALEIIKARPVLEIPKNN